MDMCIRKAREDEAVFICFTFRKSDYLAGFHRKKSTFDFSLFDVDPFSTDGDAHGVEFLCFIA
jgi:hypothetical protein